MRCVSVNPLERDVDISIEKLCYAFENYRNTSIINVIIKFIRWLVGQLISKINYENCQKFDIF